MLGVVVADRGDDSGRRLVDDVGGVDPAAKPHFEQQHVGDGFGEEQKGSGGGNLEDRDRLPGIGVLAAAQGLDEALLVDEAPAADLP
jgi:hypothetical protein